MATEKRLDLVEREAIKDAIGFMNLHFLGHGENKSVLDSINEVPTIDAVPVDEIWVDIMSLSLENQEVVLNVSICGKPNEVKIPFSKEVAEVVHGRLIPSVAKVDCTCSVCRTEFDNILRKALERWNYCPNCGAKMDGEKKDSSLLFADMEEIIDA